MALKILDFSIKLVKMIKPISMNIIFENAKLCAYIDFQVKIAQNLAKRLSISFSISDFKKKLKGLNQYSNLRLYSRVILISYEIFKNISISQCHSRKILKY